MTLLTLKTHTVLIGYVEANNEATVEELSSRVL